MPYNFFFFFFHFYFWLGLGWELLCWDGVGPCHNITSLPLRASSACSCSLPSFSWPKLPALMTLLGVAGGCCNSKALLIVQDRVRGQGTFSGSVSDSGSGFAYGSTMHDAREI